MNTPHMKYRLFNVLLQVVRGEFPMPWWRKGSQEEDEVMADSAEIILKAAGDADFVARIEAATGKNIREQLTVEEAEDLVREAKLRRWPWRN
jgi:hypothetical protein